MFGMYQHLHDSMHFLYKQKEATYKDLQSATHEAEMEWTESKISVTVMSVNVEECKEEEATELKNKIDSLTAILMSSTLPIGKPEGKEKKEQEKMIQKGGQRKSKSTPTTPMKGKGLGTPAIGPSKVN